MSLPLPGGPEGFGKLGRSEGLGGLGGPEGEAAFTTAARAAARRVWDACIVKELSRSTNDARGTYFLKNPVLRLKSYTLPIQPCPLPREIKPFICSRYLTWPQ